ncbi:MAG: phosphotransferase family protein, partial [Pedococcus sp.]
MSRAGGIPLSAPEGTPVGDEVPGLPRTPFTAWAARAVPELGPDWTAQVISGGLSNITYHVSSPTTEVIVRRPPLGKLLPSAHDMGREARVLSALWSTAVPVPQVLAATSDPDVVGAPFYVMALVEGTVYRDPSQTAELAGAQRDQLSDSLVEVLAAIHAVDLDTAGLRDFGKPDGYLERQVRRWSGQWEASRTRDLPRMDDLIRGLDAQRPTGGE